MLTRRAILAGMAAMAMAAGPVAAAAGLQLLMVRRRGCVYCAQWDREIAPVYGRHTEGRAAPLLLVDRDGPWPDGLVLARRPWLTPTFILLQGGVEQVRVEGYPGRERFFEVLRDMLAQAG
ncbi:SoxS protein [Paracoccus sp. P2]|uniref:SoxS protein n=1 Tax=Paracoccus pantotrophus TaxID=82367 RepID=A0A7H9BY35_PARPN|nr:SoxS protein [Paracoccus pantotrophus]MDF3854691.1 SoxS protein [Paracoccus pantotrophus]QLH15738.1 SoxS protein [Paracoccus pantotrophus]RDD95939.1 SoxS protein [Paracoccus pantotrophus]RNI19756.1 SoxS protein [Paracoccus pantotrophus]WGR63939.1 SoxS protein [Paracoccus pantotrophus]